MSDLIAAIGLAIVFEGILYTLFPNAMRRMIIMVLATPVPQIRTMGLIVAVIGVIVIWMVRGH